VPYQAAARIELQTVTTVRITLYCTWLSSDLATGLHGQADVTLTHTNDQTRSLISIELPLVGACYFSIYFINIPEHMREFVVD